MKIALITARSNSFRIKNKNIKKFFGRPVIAYPIKTALSSNLFDYVYINTNCKRISKIAKIYGASVPFIRPNYLSNDKVGTLDVIKHFIKKKLKNEKKRVDICCIYPVTPLLNKEILLESFSEFKKNKNDFLVPVLKKKNNRNLYLTNKGFINEYKHKKKGINLLDTGQFYWGTNKSFSECRNIFSKKCKPYYINKNRALDVNTPRDWKILKRMYKHLSNKSTFLKITVKENL
jgi:pseudaminic acid cytidylyltransferase